MRKLLLTPAIVVSLALSLFTFQASASAAPASASCWGQASAVFAQIGVMGQHAAEQPTPRIGLRNLARALYDQGIIEDDSMQALGAFVAAELGLSIEACQ